MKYIPANIYGDAGEHLVAARVIKLFGFPCRLTNIDIGLDAEIEIIDEYYRSTGQFIKAQIKSKWQDNKMFVYVDAHHISYWNSIDIPVVIFLVHLSSEEIYWHSIDNIAAYKKSGENFKVTFCAKDLLTVNSKNSFLQAMLTRDLRMIKNLYYDAASLTNEDKVIFDKGEFDLTTFEYLVYNANRIRYKLDKADKMIRKNPSLLEKLGNATPERMQIDLYLSKIEELKHQAMIDHGGNFFDALDSKSNNFD